MPQFRGQWQMQCAVRVGFQDCRDRIHDLKANALSVLAITDGVIGLEKISVGGRPLQTTLNGQRQAMIFERLMELVMQVQKRLFDVLVPQRIVDLFKLGQGTPPRSGIATTDVVDGFFAFLGFTRLASDGPIRKAVVRGIHEGSFAFVTGGVPTLDAEGKFQVSWDKIKFKMTVAEDEVDLDSGFIILPSALPARPVPGETGRGDETSPGPDAAGRPPSDAHEPLPGEPPVLPPGGDSAGNVALTFRAGRNDLFAAWPALANLADLTGELSVTVTASSDKPIDKGKLENGVYEPLRELGLLKE